MKENFCYSNNFVKIVLLLPFFPYRLQKKKSNYSIKPRSHSANLLARVVAAITRCMGIAAMSVVTLKIHSRYLLERNLNLLAINMLRFGLKDCEKIIKLCMFRNGTRNNKFRCIEQFYLENQLQKTNLWCLAFLFM